MCDELISIIVPVYNVELYLAKCIESLISQTYRRLEIIIVDDGSPDNSGRICDEYAERDDRIKVIHQENGGLSAARNTGLDHAMGNYIAFVDSDDWVENTFYEKMLIFLKENSCDLVECGVNLVTNTSSKQYEKSHNEIMTGREALKRHLDIYNRLANPLPRTAVWSKLCKRELWKEKRFPVGEIHEDYLLTCQIFFEARRVGLLKEGLYNHLVSNPNSIVNSRFSKKDLYKEKQLRFRIDYLKEKKDIELAEMAEVEYYDFLPSVVWRCEENGIDEWKAFLGKIKQDKEKIKALNLPDKRKKEYFMLFYFSKPYLIMRRIFNKIRRSM